MRHNTLYYGDCLEVMREWPDACVDLIYLDPPFNSNADYNILFGNQKSKTSKIRRKDLAQITAFTDTWEWSEKTAKRIGEIKKAPAHCARKAVMALDSFYDSGTGMLAYLVYMADRINEMHRILKDTGSIYLHCDPTASHYLKMIMDDVFGAKNFRNEIIWERGTASGGKARGKKFIPQHDVIFCFVKTKSFTFTKHYTSYTNEYIKKRFVKSDDVGVYREQLGGRKQYLKDSKGKPMSDIWCDVYPVNPNAAEKLGYPTQKPLALLNRIVNASSNEGDVILDPFCGCGTTVEAALKSNRDFVGIDISMYALDVIQTERLKDTTFKVEGVPTSLRSAKDMARNFPFRFEKWAVHRIPGFVTNNKQTGDGGVDGWAGLLHTPEDEDGMCIAQVKGGSPNVDSIKALLSQINGGYASVGVFITLEKWDTPTVRRCIADAGTLQQGANEFNRLVTWSVEEHFVGIKPNLPQLSNPRTGKPLQEDLMVRG